jgi:uncharacterized protein
MLDRLPEYIDPLSLADKRGFLKGEIPINNLDRLADTLFDHAGSITVELFFEREGRLAKIEGRIQGVLNLKCQNCLDAISWPFDNNLKLGIVSSIDQANRLPEDFEPLLLQEDNLLLKEIIEDELMLALPPFPKHQYNCFTSNLNNSDETPLTKDEESPKINPFSILANLK